MRPSDSAREGKVDFKRPLGKGNNDAHLKEVPIFV